MSQFGFSIRKGRILVGFKLSNPLVLGFLARWLTCIRLRVKHIQTIVFYFNIRAQLLQETKRSEDLKEGISELRDSTRRVVN